MMGQVEGVHGRAALRLGGAQVNRGTAMRGWRVTGDSLYSRSVGRTLNIAHRGGAGLRPENTMAAFSAAIAKGYDGAELDVQLSSDGVVVVHHDLRLNPVLTRHAGAWISGTTPAIKDLSFAALQAFDIGRADPASAYMAGHPKLQAVEGERIPSLDAVVARAMEARLSFWLFVELKTSAHADSGDPIALAEEALAAMEAYLDRTIFVGFDWRGLMRIKELSPGARCWFTTEKLQGDLRPVLDGIAHAKADGWFAEKTNATAENVAYARQIGLKVGAWTVNDPAEMKKLLDLKLDAICTDRPDVLESFK
jgi:glycerophosphoryl diester phosphodiesterase